MSNISKVALAALFLVVCGAQTATADSARRGPEQHGAAEIACQATQACANQVKETALFCIADDRCSAFAPRPVAALVRYDARMDQLR